MNKALVVVFLLLFASMAWAQADDMAAERARLANQRIEAEARAREEQERQARLAAERELAAVPQQTAPPVAVEARRTTAETPAPTPQSARDDVAPGDATIPSADVDRILQQIRTLGELRDAGYVTDAEFERIKRRILDGAL